jgi:hypothetical protein
MHFFRRILQTGEISSFPSFQSVEYNSKDPLPSDYYQLAVGHLENKQKKTQQFA